MEEDPDRFYFDDCEIPGPYTQDGLPFVKKSTIEVMKRDMLQRENEQPGGMYRYIGEKIAEIGQENLFLTDEIMSYIRHTYPNDKDYQLKLMLCFAFTYETLRTQSRANNLEGLNDSV